MPHDTTNSDTSSSETMFRHYRQWNPRLIFFYGALAALFALLSSGLAYRQLILQNEYREREERMTQRRIIQPGPRGRILDRHGEILVANRPRFAAVIYLDELQSEIFDAYLTEKREREERHVASGSTEPFAFDRDDAWWTARQKVLQRYLDEINIILEREDGISRRDMYQHFGHSLLKPFELVNDLSAEEYAILMEQLPIGSKIDIHVDTARSYPNGSVAAHTIGYVKPTDEIPEPDLPADDIITTRYPGEVGVNGIERAFDEHLVGESGGEIWIVDRLQYKADGEPLVQVNAKPGKDLVTSLDLRLQKAAEKALAERTGSVVALDVNTGEVLVMASKPDYDLNRMSPRISQDYWNELMERKAFQNLAIRGLYEPGSTFKMVTAIAGMRNGTLDPDEKIDCGPFLQVGNRKFPEHGGGPFGPTDLAKALEKSSNVYFYHEGLEATHAAIAREARRMGFHEKTEIEVFSETGRTHVPDRQWKEKVHGMPWMLGDTANMSIGQGDLRVTPLHMAAFTASLARRETRTNVTILHDPERKPVDHGGEPLGLTDSQYAALLEGMRRAVSNSGTARLAQVRGVDLAGKTGTAQIRRRDEDSGDIQRLTLAWTVVFGPVEDPEIAVAVVVEGTEISDHYAGGRTAAPVAQAVLLEYFYGPERTILMGMNER